MHNKLFYFYLKLREGYMRTSSEEFNLSKENKDNHFIHLTNNAVQKYSTNYGQFEDGNQLSFEWMQVNIILGFLLKRGKRKVFLYAN